MDTTTQADDPYHAANVEVAGPGQQLLAPIFAAFGFIALLMIVIPHSAGSSSRSVGGLSVRSRFQAYGLPKWITITETNGITSWSLHPGNAILLLTIAARPSPQPCLSTLVQKNRNSRARLFV